MTRPPANIKIYHITHVDNLASILATGCIESDGLRYQAGQSQTTIGMTEIKRRRMFEINVPCCPGTKVGDYVPFYFCSRSIMLFIIYRNNHRDMSYRGGQQPILHLQADMKEVVNWACENDVYWAFSDRNAGSYYSDFYNNVNDLENIDWSAVMENDFRDPTVKDGKQAEFLIHGSCPWYLIEKIGVIDKNVQQQVDLILQGNSHKPFVSIERTWYY